MVGRRFFERGEGGDAVEAAIRVGRRHKVKTPINRQRRPDTCVGQSHYRRRTNIKTSNGSKKPPASYMIPPTEGPKISANPNEA